MACPEPAFLPSHVSQGPALTSLTIAGSREVQLIQLRSDPGTTVSGGTFRIGVNWEGINAADPEQPAMTAPIAFDADAITVQRELARLTAVGPTEVRRLEPGSQNGYAYQVTFDWGRDPAQLRGDIPPLFLDVSQLQVGAGY